MTDFNHTKQVYNAFADYYVSKRSNHKQSFYNIYLSNHPLKKQLKEIIRGKKVLDLGCGQGVFTHELYQLGADIEGIDISDRLIDIARSNYKEITFTVANAVKTKFANHSFDIIVANLVVHYFKNLSPLFKEVSRLLKKRGVFVFSIHHPFNETMKKQWNDGAMKIVLEPYFHNKKYHWKMGEMELISYHHTFTEISIHLKKHGFCIAEIEESRAPRRSEKVDKASYDFSNQYPTFCIIKAEKR